MSNLNCSLAALKVTVCYYISLHSAVQTAVTMSSLRELSHHPEAVLPQISFWFSRSLSPLSINLNTFPSPSWEPEPIALSSRNSNNCLAPTPVFALSLWLYPTVPPLTQHQSSVAQAPPTVESYCLKSSPCPTSPG